MHRFLLRFSQLALALLGLVFFVGTPAVAEVPTKIHGRVVLDANANGQLDSNEQGMPGIAVTDGVQIVQTNEQGEYELTVMPDPVQHFLAARTIAVSWPSGHWPSSAWWRRLADLPADGKLDFGLRKDEQKLPITILHLTDPHNGFAGDFNKILREEVARMGKHIQLAFATGDLGYATAQDEGRAFLSVQQYTQTFPVPFMHAIGNHDVIGLHGPDWNQPTDYHGNGAFTKYVSPIRWSFDYAGIHFAALDWSHREGSKLETSGIEREAADWLQRDFARLKPPARIYFFMHSAYDKTGRLWPILKKYQVELFLAGHSHRNVDEVVEGIPYLMTMNHAGPYKLVNILPEPGFQVIHRCMGCKNPGTRHRANNHSYPKTGTCRVALPGLDARRGATATLADQTVSGEQAAGNVKAQRLEADITVERGTAKSWGLRIGPDAQGKSVELLANADDLRCGEVTTDPARAPGQTTDKFHLVMTDEGISVWSNEHARFDAAYSAGSPVGITLLARDGAAKFTKVDVWELKEGPPIRQYKEK